MDTNSPHQVWGAARYPLLLILTDTHSYSLWLLDTLPPQCQRHRARVQILLGKPYLTANILLIHWISGLPTNPPPTVNPLQLDYVLGSASDSFDYSQILYI